MENLKLNETICFCRKKQGLTQEELAVKLGVTNQTVSKWELAQCCPEISLIPKLAEIFDISIDELFGKEPKLPETNDDLCTRFPWADDETIRVIFARGHQFLRETNDINEYINIEFPENCNETTKKCFKVEIFGNAHFDASINGDVVSHGAIECNQINGNIKECKEDITCNGNINGNVNAEGAVTCAGYVGGKVDCSGDVTCGDAIGGDVKSGGTITCGGGISGEVKCCGNIECKTIEGNVECKGDIIYK